MFLLNQDHRPLKTAVRNAVIEIRRLTSLDQWFHVDSAQNLADLGTRSASISEIGINSEWQNGKAWMTGEWEDCPLRPFEALKLSSADHVGAVEEIKAKMWGMAMTPVSLDKVTERYRYSRYVVDPRGKGWLKAVRTMALVLRFVRRARKQEKYESCKFPSTQITEEELLRAEKYFFSKTSAEVKKFCKPEDYKDCSVERDGVLLFTSRLLDGQKVLDMENVMGDVTPQFFQKPLVERHSPVGYAVMLYSHEVLTNHGGSVAALRESRSIARILKGRELAEEVKKSCIFCRRFDARPVDVKMGPVHPSRITVAPAFYQAQCDLFGPLVARCEHNHRASIKVWGVVFKDPASGAISIHAMPDYSTSSFVSAYARHGCRYGYAKKL